MFLLQVNFEKWSHGEPNNYDGNEKCGVFTGYLNMNWNDLFCEHMLDYVCQIKKGKITSCLQQDLEVDKNILPRSDDIICICMY